MRETLIALGAAAGASLCCTGPVVLASVGATTLAGFAWMDSIRPYLFVGALGLIGWASWRSYRPSAAADCCSLAERTSLKRQRQALWLATPVMAVLLAFPYLQAAALGVNGEEAVASRAGVTESNWAIAGMTCTGCAAGLEGSLAAQPGMLSCLVSFEDGNMRCLTEKGKIDTETIPALVSQLAFESSEATDPANPEPPTYAKPEPQGG